MATGDSRKSGETRTEIVYAAPQRCADVAIAGGETVRRIEFGLEWQPSAIRGCIAFDAKLFENSAGDGVASGVQRIFRPAQIPYISAILESTSFMVSNVLSGY